MGLTQGDVRITIGVTGKGDTKVVKDAKKDVEGLGEKIGTSMKSSVGPLDKVRSGFDAVSANAGFLVGTVTSVVGIVGGAVAAFIEFASGADKGAAATKQWAQDLKALRGAIDRAWEALDKSGKDPITAALVDVNIELFKARTTIADVSKGTQEWWEMTRQIRNLEEARAHLEADIRRDMEASRDAIRSLYGTMQDINSLGPVQVFRGSSQDDSMKVGVTKNPLTGEDETPEMRAAREKRLADAIKKNRPRGGGGPKKLSPEDVDQLLGGATNADGLNSLWEMFANGSSAGSPNANNAGLGGGDSGAGGKGKSRMQMLAGDVRDFTAALSESLPGMDAFTGALSQISSMWGEYAETGKGAARATIMSVGAIAMAGAEQIKNERLRAGVLSIIHLGLGTALMFVPGQQQEALGHLAGAAILGSVAIFGGSSSGGGKSSPGGSRSVVRPLSDARQGSGGINITINGDWHGQSSPQETAAALHARINAGRSSGYVPARAA